MEKRRRLPDWMRMERASGATYSGVKRIVETNSLHTICTSGNCPNIGECWNAGTATFMILGDICTRSCSFCGTRTGKPLPPDKGEPKRLAAAVKLMKLKHVVVTSVDRDDLADKGANHWAECIRAIKSVGPGITLETLIPDFDAIPELLDIVIEAAPDVISHNVETVRRLTPQIRSRAKYETSLAVIKHLSDAGAVAKSGFMVGLGETRQEISETMQDLFNNGCSVLTIGQYLQPSLDHMPVVEYIHPETFKEYHEEGLRTGFRIVESSPLVRSSFHAERHVSK